MHIFTLFTIIKTIQLKIDTYIITLTTLNKSAAGL